VFFNLTRAKQEVANGIAGICHVKNGGEFDDIDKYCWVVVAYRILYRSDAVADKKIELV